MNKLEATFELVAHKLNLHDFYIKKHIEEFSRDIEKVSEILDIGGGSTPYKGMFDCNEYTTIEVDINRYKNIDIFGDITNLPIKKGKIDCIICTEVLEHVKDVDKAFKELNRVLKREGYLILTIPFIIGIHDKIDFYRFTETALRQILEKYDFDVISLYKRGGIFSSLGAILFQLPYQTFGPYTNKKNYMLFGIIFLFYLCIFPVIKVCYLLDIFDKNKNYTLGYDILVKKK